MALENPSNDALQNLCICDNENSVLFKTGSEWTRLTKPRQGEIIVKVTVTLCLIGLGVLTALSIVAYMKISVDVKELQDSFKSANGLTTRQGNDIRISDDVNQLKEADKRLSSELQQLKDLQLGDHINQMQTLMEALNMSTLSELQNLKGEGIQISENLNVMTVSLNNVNSSLLSKFQRMEQKDLQLGDHINQMQTLMEALNMSTLSELQNLKGEGIQISENLNVMTVSLNNVNSSLLSKFQRMEQKDLQLGDHINQMQTLMEALNMSTLSELQNLKGEGIQISENLNVMTVSLNNVNSSLLSKFQRMEQKAVIVLDNIQTMQDSLSRVGLNVQTLKEADKQFSQVQEQNSNSIQLFKDSVSLQLQQVKSLVASLSDEMQKLEELNSTLMSILELKDRKHCPKDFMFYGDKCYLFSLTDDTFPNAKRECQLKQSYLMVIHNEAEQKFIADRLDSNFYWIGLTDSIKEGDWRWEDGTSYSSTPKFWKTGQPDNFQHAEHCAHLVADGLWNDIPCTMKYKYTCQKLPG